MVLVNNDDARMGGVVTALTMSGQGSEVSDKNDLRPGDLLQYWKQKPGEPSQAAGHAVVVHRVRTSEGVLDERSPSAEGPRHVSGIGVLSAHTERDGQPDVYTKGFVDPDVAYMRWFAVRPAGSPWAMR